MIAISSHAIERYQSRIARVPRDDAADAIADLLRDARIRATPRHWMRRTTSYGDGVRFAYSPRVSSACLVIRGATVVTIITRGLCQGSSFGGPERRPQRGDSPERCQRLRRKSGRR